MTQTVTLPSCDVYIIITRGLCCTTVSDTTTTHMDLLLFSFKISLLITQSYTNEYYMFKPYQSNHCLFTRGSFRCIRANKIIIICALSLVVFFTLSADGIVAFYEFYPMWNSNNLGNVTEALRVFLNLDVDRDAEITVSVEIPYVWWWFDFNGRQTIKYIQKYKQLKLPFRFLKKCTYILCNNKFFLWRGCMLCLKEKTKTLVSNFQIAYKYFKYFKTKMLILFLTISVYDY